MADADVDVSVIVAVRNGASTLAQCIDSVLSQTGCALEILIVDAMSNDGTKEIVESYGDRLAIYIREPDHGIYDAWNKALAVTSGEWCAFLGADDYYFDGQSVAKLLKCAREALSEPVFVFGGILRVGGLEEYVVHPNPPNPVMYLRSGKMLPHPGSLHRVDALRSIGCFDASYRIAGDFDAALKLSRVGLVQRCGEVVTVMRVGGVSNAWAARKSAARERYRIVRRERGILVAKTQQAQSRVLQAAGRIFELGALAILPEAVALALVLRTRRALGRPPKLL